MTYLQILASVLIFFIISNQLFHIKVYTNFQLSIMFSAIFLVLGFIWDSYAVSAGHWQFSEKHLLGINMYNLPLEEYLFFIIIPYCSISLYKTISSILPKKNNLL